MLQPTRSSARVCHSRGPLGGRLKRVSQPELRSSWLELEAECLHSAVLAVAPVIPLAHPRQHKAWGKGGEGGRRKEASKSAETVERSVCGGGGGAGESLRAWLESSAEHRYGARNTIAHRGMQTPLHTDTIARENRWTHEAPEVRAWQTGADLGAVRACASLSWVCSPSTPPNRNP